MTGVLLMGSTRSSYSTLAAALNELLFCGTVQDCSNTRYLIFETGFGTEFQFVVETIYIWSFIILVIVCLLNVVIAILVDAFTRLQEGEHGENGQPFLTVIQSLTMCLTFLFSTISSYTSMCSRKRNKKRPLSRFERLVKIRKELGRSQFLSAIWLRKQLNEDIIKGYYYEAMLAEIRRLTKKRIFAEASARLLAIGEPSSAEVQGEMMDLLASLNRASSKSSVKSIWPRPNERNIMPDL